jgi:twitching motility protein PilT
VTDLAQILVDAVGRGASDIVIKAGNSPLARVKGELIRMYPEAPKLMPPDTEAMARQMMPEYRIKEFENEQEADFAYAVPGLGRFRVNAFKQRGSTSLVMRAIPVEAPTFAQLNLPEVVRNVAEEERGIVLVTGTTGSGKSTTLAAMIRHINATMKKHIVTIEDPIEYLYRDEESGINQREIGSDTATFKRALRRVLRQDPDVILIGEMRDDETVQTALSAAETGHLVFSTLHTADAAETVNRILEFYPAGEQSQARAVLASTLRAVISQRLVPTADGHRRTAILEVLRTTGRVQDTIKEGEVSQLSEIISEGAFYGMQSFDQALYNAVKSGLIDMDTAMANASKPHDFKLLVQGEGRVGTTMADVIQEPDEDEAGDDSDQNGGSTGRDPSSLIPGL